MKCLILACLFIMNFSVYAQEVAKNRTCRILFLERHGEAPTEAYLFDGEKSHKVLLPSLNFSEVVELPVGDITIGMSPESIDSPEDFPRDAPTAKIPAQQNDIYLLLFSDPGNKILPVRIQPINIGKGNLEPGQTLWINYTQHRIAAKLGTEELLIPAMGKAVSPPPLATSGYFLAQFLYQPDATGDFSPIMRKSWWFDAKSKNLGFIINTGGRLPKIFTFRDRRLAESPAGKE